MGLDDETFITPGQNLGHWGEKVLAMTYEYWLATKPAEIQRMADKQPVRGMMHWLDHHVITMGLPADAGLDVAALKLAAARGKYVVVGSVMRDVRELKQNLSRADKKEGFFTTKRSYNANLRGLTGIQTVVFVEDGLAPRAWREALSFVTELFSAERLDDKLILRIGTV